MKKRLLSILLLTMLLITLLPTAYAADSVDISDYTAILGMDKETPKGFDAQSSKNPYGYNKNVPFMLSTENELLFHYSYDTNSSSGRSVWNWFDTQNGANINLWNKDSASFQESGSRTSGLTALSYTEATAFDPTGNGRQDRVCYVGYDDSSKSLVANILGADASYSSASITLDTTSDTWIRKEDLEQYKSPNFFSVTAGDYNGDGKESLVIYVIGKSGPKLYEISYDGSRWNTQTFTAPLHTDYQNSSELTQSNAQRNQLGCTLSSGDFNGDRIDDLAVLSYCNYISNDTYKTNNDLMKPQLSVGLGSASASGAAALSYSMQRISGDGSNVPKYASGMNIAPYAPGMDVGDIDGDGYDEAVISGYITKLNDKNEYPDPDDNYLLVAVYGNTAGTTTQLGFRHITSNPMTKEMSAMGDMACPPVAVACVAINGQAAAEYVFISGELYAITRNAVASAARSPSYLSTGLSFFRHGTGNITFNRGLFQSVAAGNFDGNDAGREQLYFTFAAKRSATGSADDDYAYKIGRISASAYDDKTDAKGATQYGDAVGFTDTVSSLVFGSTADITEVKGDNVQERLNCLVVAIDKDEDGLKARYNSSRFAYTSPTVLTILQAAPWFSELGGYGDFQGSTTYGMEQSYTFAQTSGSSVSFGTGVSIDADSGIGIKIALEAGYSQGWSKSFETSQTTTYSADFTAGAQDSVVISRTPTFIYGYDTYEKGGWKSGSICLSLPQEPTYFQMSVKDYNDFVTTYNAYVDKEYGAGAVVHLKAIEDAFLGNEGNPFGYRSNWDATGSGALAGVNLSLGTNTISYNGSTTSSHFSQAGETTIGTETSRGFDFSLSLQAGGGIGAEAWFGVKASMESTSTTGQYRTNGRATHTSGTVYNIDQNMLLENSKIPKRVSSKYGFDWTFGQWGTTLDAYSGNVPIYGYALSNIKSPAPPVADLSAESTAVDLATLSWSTPDTASRETITGYNVYMWDKNGYTKLNLAPLAVDSVSYTAKNLASNTDYSFAVTTLGASGESVWSNIARVTTQKARVALHIKVAGDAAGLDYSVQHLGNIPIADGDLIEEGDIIYVSSSPKDSYSLDSVTLASGGKNGSMLPDFNFVLSEESTITFTVTPTSTPSAICDVSFDASETNHVPDGTVSATAGGVALAAPGGRVTGGTEITFTANANAGFLLKQWQIETGGSTTIKPAAGNSLNITALSAVNKVTAVFISTDDSSAYNTISVTDAGIGGSITVNDANGDALKQDENGKSRVLLGSSITFTADATQGYTFSGWKNGLSGAGTTNPVTIFVTSDMSVGADFTSPIRYPVTFGVNQIGYGTLSAKTGNGLLASGDYLPPATHISFNANAASAYRLDQLGIQEGLVVNFLDYSDALTTSKAYLHTLAAACNVTAYFKEIEKYTLTPTISAGGTVQISGSFTHDQPQTLTAGTAVTDISYLSQLIVTATPDRGYTLKSLTVNDGAISSGASIAVDRDLTVAAVFSPIDTGSDAGGGSSAGIPGGAMGESTKIPLSSSQGSVDVSASVKDDTATVTVTDTQLGKLTSGGAATGIIALDLSSLEVNAAVIPQNLLSAAGRAIDSDGLSVTLKSGAVKLDKTALAAVTGSGEMKISMEKVGSSALSDAQKNVLGNQLNTAVIVDVNIYLNNVPTHNFNNGKIQVSMPHALRPGESADSIAIWFVKDDGSIEAVTGMYRNGQITFETDHLSQYLIVHFPFADISSSHWAYSYIAQAYTKGLFTGTGATTLSPDTNITRGMIAAVLWRMEGSPAVDAAHAVFSDVAQHSYYKTAIDWAAKNGIAGGYGGGLFGPEDAITREQLATILFHYAKHKGYKISVGEDTNILSYNDASEISEYAVTAIQWACGVKIMKGDGAKLLPKSGATRAQAATMLLRFLNIENA